MARKYCFICGDEKEPGREKDSYCKKCKHAKRSEYRAKIRSEKGLRPWGNGPTPTCPDCKFPKDDIIQTYCNACRRRKAAQKRLAAGAIPRPCTGFCKCGAPRLPYSNSYCARCKAEAESRRRMLKGRSEAERENARKLRAANREHIVSQTERGKMLQLKKTARSSAHHYITTGTLVRQPCEKCGALIVEAHHDDYSKPLEVRWLCRKHHNEHHRLEKLLAKKDINHDNDS